MAAVRAIERKLSKQIADAPSPAAPWDVLNQPAVPVARPRLAPLEAAIGYLRRIDQARIYSNFGPLNALLEARLAERFGLGEGCVVTCSNGTVGLTLSLMAARREGELCIVPAWTFAATAHAVLAAGLTPYLVDVDPASGALTPGLAAAACRNAPGRVAAVVAVAPFGAPLDPAAWDAFQTASGVPVVIDAAAGFDALKPGRAAAVVSLHATKVLGVGEGGFVVCRDPALVAEVRRRSNFGFAGDRNAAAVGLNGKLSEYAAAVGLGALDLWPLLRTEYLSVLAYYRAALGGRSGIRIAEGLGDSWVASTFCIEAAEEVVLQIEKRLAEDGVATRRWWGRGLQAHSGFADFPAAPLPVTERLAACTLGLPCWPGIEKAALDRIISVVLSAVGDPP